MVILIGTSSEDKQYLIWKLSSTQNKFNGTVRNNFNRTVCLLKIVPHRDFCTGGCTCTAEIWELFRGCQNLHQIITLPKIFGVDNPDIWPIPSCVVTTIYYRELVTDN